jgi:hypothetical protein
MTVTPAGEVKRMKIDVKLKRAAARECDDGATTDNQLVRGTDGPSEETKNGRSDHREKRAKLANKVEKAQAVSNDLKYQLEIYREKVHTPHQQKEKES